MCSIVFDYPYLTLIPAYTYAQNEHPKPTKPNHPHTPLQVLLSLEEAEHIRGVLHARDTTFDYLIPEEAYNAAPSVSESVKSLAGGVVDLSLDSIDSGPALGQAGMTSVGLWLLSDGNATLLGSSKGFAPKREKGPQSAMTACYRYVGGGCTHQIVGTYSFPIRGDMY